MGGEGFAWGILTGMFGVLIMFVILAVLFKGGKK
jgi:hypothetical protein